MEARPDIGSLCCVNEECKQYGQRGRGNLVVRKIYGKDKIRYLRCRSCGEEFSERKGTSLYNCKISEAKAVSVIDHLDEGCGLNATARLTKVSRDAISRLIKMSGRTSKRIHDAMVRNITPKAIEFDEKWSFSTKKQQNMTAEDDPLTVGDQWDVNCIDPITKLLITIVPGKRTANTIHQAVSDAVNRLAAGARLPAILVMLQQV